MRNISRQRGLRVVLDMACALALITLALFSLNLPAEATVDITRTTDAAALANAIIDSNSNVVLTGTPVLNVGSSTNSSGTFTTTNSNLGLSTGIVLSTGNVENITSPTSTPSDRGSGIADSATREKDIATLTFSFIPNAGVDSVSFDSVFVSQEYENIAPGQLHNDNFTVMLSGGSYNNANVATIPGTTSKVGIQTLNKNTNASYYRDNRANPRPLPDIRYYGATTALIRSFAVVPGTTYTATIRIADGVDGYVNSAVFIGVIRPIMPHIYLDLSVAQTNTNNYMGTWTATGPAVPVTSADVAITEDNISEDPAMLASATITLKNPVQDDLLSIAGTLPTGITASAYDPATGVLTLSGTATYTAYQTALTQIRYSGTITTIGPTRIMNVIVNNGTTTSNTAVAHILIATMSITKTYTLPTAANGAARLGDVVTYSYVITNTGSVAMSNVSVQDMHGSPPVQVLPGASGITNEALTTPGPMGTAASTDTTPNDGVWNVLAPGAAVTFTWPHTVTQEEVTHG